MNAGALETEKFANIMNCVGWFLRYNGKAIDSERFLVRSFEKHRQILGAEYPNMLRSIGNLVSTYWNQGRIGEATALEKEVLEKRGWILRVEHPDKLTLMATLHPQIELKGG